MLFLVLGIVLGITTVVTLTSITLAMEKQLENNFESQGTRVLVTPVSKALSLSYNGVSVASNTTYQSPTIDESISSRLTAVGKEAVNVVAPKLVQPVETPSGNALAAGVAFEKELALKPYWKIDGEVPGKDQLLLGSLAAKQLGLSKGAQLELAGRQFTVTGILDQIGTSEDKLIYMTLGQAQQLFDKEGQVTFIEMSILTDGASKEQEETSLAIAAMQQELTEVNVAPVKDQSQARREVVDRFAKFSILVSVVVLFIGCLIVLTTMMASVKERTREIGVFRAIGFRQSHIIKIILTEALVISFAGGIVGYVAGISLAKVASPFIAQIDVQVAWSVGLGVTAVLVSCFVGLAASAYPAYQAAKLDPVEAFRFI